MSRVDQAAFPALAGQGLHVVNVKGDGNCLFRAMSDQLYGHQHKHEHIRAKVVNYMRQNPNDFKPFVEVGGSRRHAPSRKSAPKGSTKGPSKDEIDMAWEQYLRSMAKPATYGDQLTITAFAKAYNMDVLIHHQRTINNVHTNVEDSPNAAPRQIAHIAFANEHYQSVRNINGPNNGPAKTLPKDMESFEVRMAKHLARTGPASTSEKTSGASSRTIWPTRSVAPRAPSPAATRPRPRRFSGLEFLGEESDSEDENKPVNKSVDKPATKLAPKSEPVVNSPTLGSTTTTASAAPAAARRNTAALTPPPTPRLAPLKDEGLKFLDAFKDDPEDKDEDWSPSDPNKMAPASTPGPKTLHPTKVTGKRVRIPAYASRLAPATAPTSSPAKKRKRVDSPTPAPRRQPIKRRRCVGAPVATPSPAPAQAPTPEQDEIFWIDTLDSDSENEYEDWCLRRN
ncbi:hypothetical protein ACEPPN_006818 [Leptodophora sp. 'Broadleaf-Isolate-01']